METVGVIFFICNSLDLAVSVLILSDESAGEAFCRCGEECEVHLQLLRLVVAEFSHVADDFKALGFGFFGFSVVLAVENRQCFCQTDESHGECSVLEDFSQLIGELELVGIQPYALSHQEREVIYVLACLYLESVEELLCHEFHHSVQFLVEDLLIALGFQCQSRQVDGCEGQVAS